MVAGREKAFEPFFQDAKGFSRLVRWGKGVLTKLKKEEFLKKDPKTQTTKGGGEPFPSDLTRIAEKDSRGGEGIVGPEKGGEPKIKTRSEMGVGNTEKVEAQRCGGGSGGAVTSPEKKKTDAKRLRPATGKEVHYLVPITRGTL